MAQILSFPKTSAAQARRLETIRDTAHQSAPATAEAAECLAEFERMMAFHTVTRQLADDFNRLCEQAMATRPTAELVYFPAACHA